MGSDVPTTQTTAAPVKRRKHLMDPNAPRERRDVSTEKAELTHVQQWVMSVLVVTTVVHLSAGLIIAALTLSDPAPGAEVGLIVIGGVVMVLGLVGARLIHRKKPLSPWLLFGLAPLVVGLFLLYR